MSTSTQNNLSIERNIHQMDDCDFAKIFQDAIYDEEAKELFPVLEMALEGEEFTVEIYKDLCAEESAQYQFYKDRM